MASKPAAVIAGDTATAAQYNNLCDYAEDVQTEYAPAGRISIWTGTLANIPSGWYLCDGNNGTPNLLERFLQCVPDAITNPGSTGGATAKTTAGHAHDQNLDGDYDDKVGTGVIYTIGGASGGALATTDSGAVDDWEAVLTGVQSNTDGISDIRPKYYEVAFILKS